VLHQCTSVRPGVKAQSLGADGINEVVEILNRGG
jgi:hypothetical protein